MRVKTKILLGPFTLVLTDTHTFCPEHRAEIVRLSWHLVVACLCALHRANTKSTARIARPKLSNRGAVPVFGLTKLDSGVLSEIFALSSSV